MGRNKNKAPAKSGGSLGRSLTKQKQKDSRARKKDLKRENKDFQQTEQSITHQSDLQSFLSDALLADRKFDAEHSTKVVLYTSGFMKPEFFELSDKEREARLLHQTDLKIPRRPAWSKSMSRDELEKAEETAFIEWRRKLAELERNENLLLTPFERNLDVWRQLWRVVERTDLIVQIVDGRNPLQFRSLDLERYVKELGKRSLILVNKADFLTRAQRLAWGKWYREQGVQYAFFSAAQAAVALGAPSADERGLAAKVASAAIAAAVRSEEEAEENSKHLEREIEREEADGSRGIAKVLTREELLALLVKQCPVPAKDDAGSELKRHVGFVGCPNVGKSSTIVALLGEKRASVSATPGKTKHFQTLHLGPIVLTDCPGLVFPSFAMNKSDMIVNGFLSIDQLRERYPPVQLVCNRIPLEILEAVYGISLPEDQPLSAESLLQAYGYSRGFMTASGLPDESRAARIILKDYVKGRLLYAQAPPGASFDAEDARRAQWRAANVASKGKFMPMSQTQSSFAGTSALKVDEAGEVIKSTKKLTYAPEELERQKLKNVKAMSKNKKIPKKFLKRQLAQGDSL